MEWISELLVERFVSNNGSAFVCPQYELRQEFKGKLSADFVVLEFGNKDLIWVEVSDGGSPGSVEAKASSCGAIYLDALMQQLQHDTKGVVNPDEWTAKFLGFVREVHLDGARRKYGKDGRIYFRAVEDTCSSDRWNIRKEGLLPDTATVT